MVRVSLLQMINHRKIREKTRVTDILHYVARMKWRWAGHVARRRDNRWTIRATDWRPRNGRRNRGHPLKRWRDDIVDHLAENIGKSEAVLWKRLAQDREDWRLRVEGYARHWAD